VTHLRRFLLLIVAGCVAFAAGIALGGGPLQGESDDNSADVAAERDDLAARVDSLEASRILDESLAQTAAPDLLGARLDGRTVTVLALPDTDEEQVAGLRSAIREAGGSVAVTARLAPDLIDPAKKTYVDSVASNSVSGQPGLAEIVTGETYDQIGALISRAYVGTSDNTALDETATLVDSELQGARLVDVDGEPGRRGSLVVLVGPAPNDDAATIEAQQVILTAISRGLVRGSDGLLVVQPEGEDPAQSLAAALGSDQTLGSDLTWSAVNVAEGTAAHVTGVYALAAAAAGKGGVFGVQSGVPVLPPGLTPPTD
jgi:hypothetical protein